MRRRKLSLKRKLTSWGSFTSPLRSFSPRGKVIIPAHGEKDGGRIESGREEGRVQEKWRKVRDEDGRKNGRERKAVCEKWKREIGERKRNGGK